MSKLEAVIFDWAGTMVDFGSVAPMGAFVEAFAEFGLEISTDDARAPMGMAKRDHIAAILAMPHIAGQFRKLHGHASGPADIDRIYSVFLPLNEKIAGDHADLVPGAAEAIARLRERGLRIGSTTGYTRSIMDRILPIAANQGYAPDNLVCSDEVKHGRPSPDAMLKCFSDLGVSSPSRVIKVDDTTPGIGEGIAAGCITVGVCLSGNHCGKSPDQLENMDMKEINRIRTMVSGILRKAGAHHVIDTVRDLPELVERIEASMPGTPVS